MDTAATATSFQTARAFQPIEVYNLRPAGQVTITATVDTAPYSRPVAYGLAVLAAVSGIGAVVMASRVAKKKKRKPHSFLAPAALTGLAALAGYDAYRSLA